MRVLMSGATGFVGKHVLDLLLQKGHEVWALARNPEKSQRLYPDVHWLPWSDAREALDLGKIGKIDAVVNLAGENLSSKRWNNVQKKEIYNSRIDGTRSIFQMLKNAGQTPEVFVSTSAVGIYGDRKGESVTEGSVCGNDFLANLCQAWEGVALENQNQCRRLVILRVGLVLGKDGGMMQKLKPLFKAGLGGKLGNGQFYMSWIHVKDLARMYVAAVEDSTAQGIFNATAPFPVRNAEFTKVLADALRKPAVFGTPKFVLKLAMGEMADYMTKGAKALPQKFKEANFHFLYPTIELAVKDVVSNG